MQRSKMFRGVSYVLAAVGALAATAAGQQRPSDAPQGSPAPVARKVAPAPQTPRDTSRPLNKTITPGAPKAPAAQVPFDPSRPASEVVGDGNGHGGGVQDTGITLLDFENFKYEDNGLHDLPRDIYEDGFVVSVDGGDTFPFATNGTQNSWYCGSTAIYNNTIGGTSYVYAYDLSPFTLEFMEFANFSNSGPVSVTVYGVQYDGTIVSRTCTTSTSDNREETFYFNGFNDLYYVYWVQDSPFHQFDNIGVVRAPVIMDFQALEHADANIDYTGASYYENGFLLWNESGNATLATFGTLESRYPGSTALFNNEANGTTGLTQADGSPFNIHSIDISNLNNTGPVTVKFVGTRPDGFQVSKTVKTSGAPNKLETFQLPGFTNLVVVKWTQDSPYHQFDNIVITRGQQIVDFVKLSIADDETHYWGNSFRQDGFRITQGPNEPQEFATFGTLESRFPGSTSLFNNTVNGLIHIESIDQELFQLRGIEVAPLNSPSPVTVDFVGTKSDGSQLNKSITTSGNQIRLETFDFPGTWRGLKSVEWTQVSPYHQFDNVRLVRQTPLVDIQKAEHMDAGLSDLGKVYAEAGFRLTKGPDEPYNFACYGTLASNYNGSTAIFNNTVNGLIRLSCVDGGDFDLLQMDLSTLTSGIGDAYITFTGTKTDGTQVVQGFNVEDAFLTPQTCRFRGFDTLKYVEWVQASPFHQIDNIVAIEAVYPDGCYADCDGDGDLTLFDFLCFVNAFNAQQGYANCDGNGSLDLFDFLCYVNAFNAGC